MDIGADLRRAYEDGYTEGQWNVFNRIATAWFKEQCYLMRVDGVVCSRVSWRYMPLDEAVHEFIMQVELTKSRCENVAGFIAKNLLDAIRNDVDIDNLARAADMLDVKKVLESAAQEAENASNY